MCVLREQLQPILTLIFGYSQTQQGKVRKAQGREMASRLLKQALASSILKNYCNSQRSAVMDQLILNAVMMLKCLSWDRGYLTLACHSQQKASLSPPLQRELCVWNLEAKDKLQHCIFAAKAALLSRALFTLWVTAKHRNPLRPQRVTQCMSTHLQFGNLPVLFAPHSTPVMEILTSGGSSQEVFTCQWQVEAVVWCAISITPSTSWPTFKAPSLRMLWAEGLKPGWESGLFRLIWFYLLAAAN